MRNIKMEIQYDGSRYKGWQKQNIKGSTVSTIQEKLENVLSKMTGEEIQVIGCGRTDAGVHATNYIANFKTDSIMKIKKMKEYIAEFLPDDIVVKSMTDVNERFHARLNAQAKTYVYTIDNNPYNDVFLRKFAFHVDERLDVNKMKEAAEVLVGTHDFASFTSLKVKNNKSTVRTLHSIEITSESNVFKIKIKGNSFLLNMMRVITGTLIEVGKGKISKEQLKEILEAKNRELAGERAPARGLCLTLVEY